MNFSDNFSLHSGTVFGENALVWRQLNRMPMDALAQAHALKKAGRFGDALRVCDNGNLARDDRQAADVLRVGSAGAGRPLRPGAGAGADAAAVEDDLAVAAQRLRIRPGAARSRGWRLRIRGGAPAALGGSGGAGQGPRARLLVAAAIDAGADRAVGTGSRVGDPPGHPCQRSQAGHPATDRGDAHLSRRDGGEARSGQERRMAYTTRPTAAGAGSERVARDQRRNHQHRAGDHAIRLRRRIDSRDSRSAAVRTVRQSRSPEGLAGQSGKSVVCGRPLRRSD